MNSRDPFNLRRNSPAATHLFRTSAAQLRQTATRAVAATETFIESAVSSAQSQPNALPTAPSNMSSYGLPNGGAATANSTENWQSSQRSRFTQQSSSSYDSSEQSSGIGEKMSSMFAGKKESLPMYKDKPYNYPPGKGGRTFLARLPPWARRRRVIVPALVALAIFSWWIGLLSPLAWFSSKEANPPRPKKGKLPLWGKKEVVDWDDRADMVRETFKISFAGYEKHGWGMCRVRAH